jgi:hypothetical protein
VYRGRRSGISDVTTFITQKLGMSEKAEVRPVAVSATTRLLPLRTKKQTFCHVLRSSVGTNAKWADCIVMCFPHLLQTCVIVIQVTPVHYNSRHVNLLSTDVLNSSASLDLLFTHDKLGHSFGRKVNQPPDSAPNCEGFYGMSQHYLCGGISFRFTAS